MAGQDFRVHWCDGAGAGAGGGILPLGCHRQRSTPEYIGAGVAGARCECVGDHHDGVCEFSCSCVVLLGRRVWWMGY